MLSIDNSVELMLKTYLGLPGRVTGLNIGRAKYAEFSESFPKLLDAINEYASDRIEGIDLGEIEWYHRLRNQLYHQGNGLTVEREKVQVYAEIARLLFKNLFNSELDVDEVSGKEQLLGAFLAAWVRWDQVFGKIRSQLYPGQERLPLLNPGELVQRGLVTSDLAEQISKLRKLRNGVVHGDKDAIEGLQQRDIDEIASLTSKVEDVIRKLTDQG